MKIFIAWSGEASRLCATAFHDRLKDVLQVVEPFMSSESIRKGQRWQTEIGSHLTEAQCALLCLTPENLASPWIHFEAGAVSKNVEHSRVTALLLDVKQTQVEMPLQQFQNTTLTRDDVFKLVKDLNELCKPKLDDARLLRAFNQTWPDLEEGIKDARRALSSQPAGPKRPARTTDDILGDILASQKGIGAKLDALEQHVQAVSIFSPSRPVVFGAPHTTGQALFLRDGGIFGSTKSDDALAIGTLGEYELGPDNVIRKKPEK